MLSPGAYCARGIMVCPDGKIFMIETPCGTHLQFPGGGSEGVDNGDPTKTFLREAKEETGVVIEGAGELKFIERFSKDDGHVWICYLTHLTQEQIKWHIAESSEGRVLRMFPRDILALHGNDMTENQYRILQNYVNGKYQKPT